MDHHRVIASPPLNLGHLSYDVSDAGEVGAAAIRGPVDHVQLHHLVDLARLQDVE